MWITFIMGFFLKALACFFKSSFSFTAKLRQWQRFLLGPPPPHMHCPLSINLPHQRGACVIADEPTRHVIITQSPQFTLPFTLGVVHSMDLNQCIRTCSRHRHFTAPKFLCSTVIGFWKFANQEIFKGRMRSYVHAIDLSQVVPCQLGRGRSAAIWKPWWFAKCIHFF